MTNYSHILLGSHLLLHSTQKNYQPETITIIIITIIIIIITIIIIIIIIIIVIIIIIITIVNVVSMMDRDGVRG